MPSALLLIDVQKIYTMPGSALFVEHHEAAIANMNRLIAVSVAASDLIIYVRHEHKVDGSDAGRMFDYLGTPGPLGFVENTSTVEFDPGLNIVSPAIHMKKQRYSCLTGTGLTEILRENGVNTVIVAGFMTNYCCETTARHAHDEDFYVDFMMDATGCPDLSSEVTQEKIKTVVAQSLQQGFARVHTTDDFLENRFLPAN
ncbi:MAG: cysteine hydrolase [Rhodospirillales bacterium]|nr:cysteine hydrolase [Rhodospirillales bacterium]